MRESIIYRDYRRIIFSCSLLTTSKTWGTGRGRGVVMDFGGFRA